MAGNRTGKTFSGGGEAALHATGDYPKGWPGHVFEKPTEGWAAGVTNEATRDIIQLELLGPEGEHGTGAIPASALLDVKYRQAGIPDVADTIKVRHVSGGVSTIQLKTYEQGWRKFQGTARHWIWLDEEPEDFRVYTECRTRIMTTGGRMWTTFTPLLGETRLVRHFLDAPLGTWYITATWDDAPHLTDEDKATLMASYPQHERDARSKGIPMLGEGAVYPISQDEITCEPFQIPFWYRRIVGIDFGTDHPTAVVWLAYDAETDTTYVTDCYRKSGAVVAIHAEAIKARGQWMHVAWPHDGLQRDKGSGQQLTRMYRKHGVNMLGKHASYRDDRGNAVEPGIMDVLERMETGRFKIFKTCADWLEEYRSYHRKDGRVVKIRDDLMDATRYAMMMLRYASTNNPPRTNQAPRTPMISTRQGALL